MPNGQACLGKEGAMTCESRYCCNHLKEQCFPASLKNKAPKEESDNLGPKIFMCHPKSEAIVLQLNEIVSTGKACIWQHSGRGKYCSKKQLLGGEGEMPNLSSEACHPSRGQYHSHCQRIPNQ